MDITTLSGVTSDYLNTFAQQNSLVVGDDDDTFESVLSAAMQSVNETNDLQNTAESEEIRFALGESDNTHDLLIAETKANIALQYTVAVRDKLVDGYKEIMQMSI
jgi:flagellar hook-basal body complex protein FliE